MRIKKGFVLRSLAGQNIVTPEDVKLLDYNKVVSLNDTAKFIWEQLQDKEVSVDVITTILMDEYEIPVELASKDAAAFYNSLLNAGILEES